MHKPTTMEIIKSHIWGPTGSVVFHVLVVFLLIKFVQFIQDPDTAISQVMVLDPSQVDIPEEIKEELEELTEVTEITDDTQFVMDDVPMDVPDSEPVDNPSEDVDLSDMQLLSDIESPVTMQGLMSGRSKIGRADGLRKFSNGFGKTTEPAVLRALEWLKRNQKPDGSWGNPGLTGLAVLTFLAHGETPGEKKYGPTVERGIKNLVASQKPDGLLNAGGHTVYQHAIATYALSEAYGMTRIPSLKGVMEKAVDHIVKGQQAGGGWDYHYKKNSGRNDISVNGWQIQALKAAYLAGAGNAGLKKALDRSRSGLVAHYNEAVGSFGYTSKTGPRPSTTAVGVLCLQLTGHAKTGEARGGLEGLNGYDCDWSNAANEGWPMYTWYYATQAKFHHGGRTWKSWNPRIATNLVKNQATDGHWDAPSDHEKKQGPVYNTTLAALTLQVYYRFLPSYQAEAVEAAEEKSEPEADPDDVIIEAG